ncbi:MAG: XdhC family protein [Clostridiales bacterium]|nr:XdhC family protein [Clostridiales bacterium]
MIELYEKISRINPNYKNQVFTVIEGDQIGKKALFSNGKLVWETEDRGFFSSHEKAVSGIEICGLADLAGNRIYSEILGNEKKIVICGGGHVSMPIISMGRMLGCHVTVLEDRPTYANNARRQGADEVFVDSFENSLRQVSGDADTYFVIVTRGHRYDRECLRAIAAKPHGYIGMIGSRRRVALVKESLAAEGVDKSVLDQVYSPIGLDIGAETPEEIAISVMAQIVEVKNKKKNHCGYSKEILKGILEPPEIPGCGASKEVLATIVRRRGSAPRETGTKMLILPDGRTIGTIGGGCVEAEVANRGRQLMIRESFTPELIHVDMTAEEAEDEGMVCGGVLDVLLEAI